MWLISSLDFRFSTAEYKTAVQTFGNPAENLQKEPSRCCSRVLTFFRVLTFSSSYASMWPNLEELSRSTSPAPSQTWFFGLVSRFVSANEDVDEDVLWQVRRIPAEQQQRCSTSPRLLTELQAWGLRATSKHQVSYTAKGYSWFVQWQAHPTAHC